MRILQVHNMYLIRGGEEECLEIDRDLLIQRGHVVDQYTIHNRTVSEIGKVRTWFRTIWSFESYGEIRAKIRAFRPDIVYVHNFFPLLSPSVYYAARAERVPVVQSLQNYRLACPNAMFFRKGRICEDCADKFLPWPGIVHACYRNSHAGSAALAAMIAFHRLLGTWKTRVDRYVVCTEFSKQKFIRCGLPADRISVKPHFVHPDPGPGTGTGDFAIFVARLSQEKGLLTLIAAWGLLQQKIPLKIVGDGPLSPALASSLAGMPGAEWVGRKPLDEVYDLLGRAAFLVVPSEWYEPFGRVVIEAYAKGVPVLASRVEALSSLVKDGLTGLHFEPGNPVDLASKAQWLFSRAEARERMGRRARKAFEEKFSAEANYSMILDVFDRAAGRARVAAP